MKPIAAPGALLSRNGERWYLTHTTTGRVFELNETARIAFEAARDTGSVEGASRALQARYPDVASDEVARDAAALFDEFVALGLLASDASMRMR